MAIAVLAGVAYGWAADQVSIVRRFPFRLCVEHVR